MDREKYDRVVMAVAIVSTIISAALIYFMLSHLL